MSKTIEAIYENGVLKPLDQLHLKEHQRVTLILQDVKPTPKDILELASRVYKNLSMNDIEEMETIILDRNHFSRD
jgi:predicted DNA-binding antitoxin AbrB/MazE fold protein